MKTTHYLTATVQKGNRLEINLPELPEGQNIEIILIVSDDQSFHESNSKSSESANPKHEVVKKSLVDRRKLMAEQAEAMQEYYQQDKSWQDWLNLDLGDIYDY